MRDLLDISATLATQAPRVPVQYPRVPRAAGHALSSGCMRCGGGGSGREGYEDMPALQSPAQAAADAAAGLMAAPQPPAQAAPPPPAVWNSTADDLLFADDEFATGQVDAPPAAPYADPLSNPAATMYAGSVNMISGASNLGSLTPPAQFRAAVGAAGLGAPTSFVPPPPTVQAPGTGASATINTTWMPMGLTNTQALVLAIFVCTGALLLLFIVGMGSAPPPVATDLPLGLA